MTAVDLNAMWVAVARKRAVFRTRAERIHLLAWKLAADIEAGYGVGSVEMDSAAQLKAAARQMRDALDLDRDR